MTRAGDRALTGRSERRHVRDRAPAREGPGRGREAEELRHPADRLVFDLGSSGRPHRQVCVETGGEEIAEHADLEARSSDEREVAWTRLRDRLVERPAGVLEHLEHPPRRLGQRRFEQYLEPVVDRRLRRTRLVEATPGFGDDLGGTVERLLAGDVETKSHAGRIGQSSQRTCRCCGARNSQPLKRGGRSGSGRRFGSRSKSRCTAIRIWTREKWWPEQK